MMLSRRLMHASCRYSTGYFFFCTSSPFRPAHLSA
ncbi:hypothetical protein I306_01257 [Cryptococcus gattii EJB2]|uniref:Uncharacterized protein n=1 Tax=Cryptococcus gattii EJB2 TaxID=1296103 RepID=A0ABR5C153_9TREE|nr:hypothetical protein I306_01257 [Cryptococcus gattii EJB2]